MGKKGVEKWLSQSRAYKHENLSSKPETHIQSAKAHLNPSTREAERGRHLELAYSVMPESQCEILS